jgi:hypothetical protein
LNGEIAAVILCLTAAIQLFFSRKPSQFLLPTELMMRSLLAIATLFLGLSTANADWVDNFGGGVAEQSWTFGALPDGFSFSSSFNAGDGGHLLVASPTAVGAGGAAAVFGFVSQSFGAPGVMIRGVLNPTQESLMRNIGVLAYLNPATTST